MEDYLNCEFRCFDGIDFYCSLNGPCSNIDCCLNDCHYEDGFFDILDHSQYFDFSIDDSFEF